MFQFLRISANSRKKDVSSGTKVFQHLFLCNQLHDSCIYECINHIK